MDQPTKQLIDFPTMFLIKAMGHANPELRHEVVAIVNKHSATKLQDHNVTLKESSKGNYVSITVNVHATSQEQLDKIYTDLHAHHLIKMTL